MSTSNLKRLCHEISSIEHDSDRYIPFDSYYIIHTRVLEGQVTHKELESWCKDLLSYKDHQPLVLYLYDHDIYAMYSCLEKGEHYLKGSHQALCSKYVSYFNNLIKGESKVECRIIEIDTQTQVFAYFSYKVFINSQQSLIDLSNGKLTQKDIVYKTLQELIDMLKETGVDWDEIPKIKRYGTFYKLKKKKNKVTIISMSEKLDFREVKKYNTFLFS